MIGPAAQTADTIDQTNPTKDSNYQRTSGKMWNVHTGAVFYFAVT